MGERNETTGETLAETSRKIVAGETKVEAEPRENNGDLLRRHGLKVYHVLPAQYDRPTIAPRGMSIVYRVKNRNVMEIATSVCHTVDEFQKHEGCKVAIEAFLAGRTAYLPMLKTQAKKPVRDEEGNIVAYAPGRLVPRPVDTLKVCFG